MTFSIAALCPRTGQYGYALTTSSMAAGGRAGFIAQGIGVVLSQARSDPRLGALGLRRLEAGRNAEETLADMLASTPHSAWRQLAVLDLQGRVAAFTGAECTNAKGERLGRGAVAVGNGLANDRVVGAMLDGFSSEPGKPFTDRLLAALESGLAAGGEAYPLRSAAVRVALPDAPFPPIDLRVDFAEAPIAELRRLWALWAPMVGGYVQRCLDPARSPPAADIEGHLPKP
ncbi:MAG TPA: DUF1028 domain-containing protein [Stellaceae bacterium]|nr:DUF1028 domain-containing protein [Stellaceae bacterium]